MAKQDNQLATIPDKQLAKRATRATLGYAFFRPESALTIGITALLTWFLPQPFGWWPLWLWPALGAVFEGLVVWTSIADEKTAHKVAAKLLREQYDPHDIKTKKYRTKVEQALEYRDEIEETIATTPMGMLQTHLYQSSEGIADWIGRIYDMAKRLDEYARDEIIQRDTRSIQRNVNALRIELEGERDPAVRAQIETALNARRAHWKSLRALASNMEQAEHNLEETLAALGSVYTQFQLVRAKKLSASQAKHLSADIKSHAQRLQDILDSMDRVYDTSSQSG